ncbi:ankyrin repeat protein [Trypanosoma theileri]|uniref:Ankyrin repeat protein n=1 Tax=Trypanosoma theileri TaxID=67003 RepID=A0A1X0P6D9_9TRYP|nr:ankyrin repeat protein [Trypanosoma theileri]ORC92203.1 ankyrin repeat protein [Trypanosoma theileri]
MATTDSRRETIYDACRRGDETRVLNYVKNGGCVTERDANGMTLLHHAAFSGDVCVVAAILAARPLQAVEVDAVDGGGWTALHYAAGRGAADVAACLLDDGANVNARDELRRTPLHVAAAAGHLEVVRRLLAAGAMMVTTTVAGTTALEAARAGGWEEVVRLLEEKKRERE